MLLADDDADEFYLFNEAIEHSGLDVRLSHVDSAGDLFSTLEKEQLPDLLFLDINMPYKDGLECLTEIKADGKLHKMPVIIYSTSKNRKSISSAYDNGADYFLVKPNNFDDMVKALTHVFAIDWQHYMRGSQQDFVLIVSTEQ